MGAFALRATIVQAPEPGRFETVPDAVITVEDGWIAAIEAGGGGEVDVTIGAVDGVGSGAVLVPGLVDLHVHAPQFPQLGTGLDLPLERWLFDYTFPLEARYADTAWAIRVWDSLVPALLANGTTTAVYYGTTHVDATTALADACRRHGQRAWVGRVGMDHPEQTPEWYRDATAVDGVAASAASIASIRLLDPVGDLVRPIVTPRFVPACTDELLTGLGELAADTGALVQTHCSESDWEHGHVIDRCGVHDANALDGFGLLAPGTVLAHSVHLDDADRALLVDRGAGVAHCPLSNAYFGNGVFPLRRALEAGVKVGLGTDIAGGPSASLLENAAATVTSSRMLRDGVDIDVPAGERPRPEAAVDAATALWLATLGGAEVLGEPIGLLEPGRRFDAVALRIDRFGTWPEVDDDDRRAEKLVRLARAADVDAVWVQGQQVV